MENKQEPDDVDREADDKRSQHLSEMSDKVHSTKNLENEAGAALSPRRSQRTRILTEKGQELHDERLKRFQHRFITVYERWKTLAKQAKKELPGASSADALLDLRTKIRCAYIEVNQAYDDLRRHGTPDGETRRRADMCDAVSKRLLDYAQKRLDKEDETDLSFKLQDQEEDMGSVFSSTVSQRLSELSIKSSSMHKLSIRSAHSSLSSEHRQEAAAELAETQATLKALQDIECEKQELELLEVENKQQLAAQELENAVRKKRLEEKRRQIERLETVKRMNAAKARLQVYEGHANEDDDISDLLHDCNLMQNKSVCSPREHKQLDSAPAQQTTQGQSTTIPPPDKKMEPVNSAHQKDNTAALAEAIAESINISRLPVPEPPVFNGDPLRYTDWKISFQMLIDRKNIPVNEKVYYLRKYVGGPAKKALEGYFLLGTDAAYIDAWSTLEERYGNTFVVAKAFRDKLASWPKMGSKDCVELREFADFLRGCQTAMTQIKSLEVLNDCVENQKLLLKLPDWLIAKWNRKVVEVEETCNMFPTFTQFVDFLTLEAKVACNPLTSLHALKSNESERSKLVRTHSVGARVLVSNMEENPEVKSCVFCDKLSHNIHSCWRFVAKPLVERVKFVQLKKLCFGCLKPGHHSKNCEKRSVCDTCKGKHPTALHEDREVRDQHMKQTERKKHPKERSNQMSGSHQSNEMTNEVTSNRVVQDMSSVYASTVVPVWLSTVSNPEDEILVYALLDNQSDTTFILQEALSTPKEPVQLKISTLTSKGAVITSQRLTGLQVRGFYSSKKISLPTTYSREFIHANLSHIPTPKTARAWSHLEHLSEEIAPLIDCDVGLLIGYDCSQALLPREVIAGKDNEPFAQRTDLGWSIIGHVNSCTDYGDAIGGSHRIVVNQVTPHLSSSTNPTGEVRYMCRTQVKEVITPPQVIRTLESDFIERKTDDVQLSQEDLRFLLIMEEGVRFNADGHCEMPLPFKEGKPNLPDNQKCADHRLKCLRRRFERNKQYHKDYVAFMDGIIARNEAEKVPYEEIERRPAWYIPHHGVYHPLKPGKIRVVFDCSAKFQGVSLNDYLLTGPELTSTLVGVLCRFRKGPVAIMCDIECMFHQFCVRPEDQDYLRFLWWEGGDFQSQPSIYRMRVHLFGAASSPGCANYGLRHIATQGQGRFSEASIRFIKRNFYVDDGLISVSTDEEAAQLASEARQLCSTGKLRIHKFISNHKEALASVPREDCAATVQNQDLALGEPQMERALGVSWCVSADQFQFRVIVSERPLTRRGVLSTVASIFHPLGLVAPFILLGKQVLQQMCQDKSDWDEPLSESLRPRWEAWLLDLKNLADIKIPRCYIPTTMKKVKKYELHHFSDASSSGYGECTYLRTISDTGKIHCSLVMGKARVSPLKITTIPRLELSAAVVAVRMSDLLRRELEIDAAEFFWTDSRVVLGYVNNDAKRFHVFVANRIQRIKDSTDPSQWRYVTSEENPADHASRGLTASELATSTWFPGPAFLWQDELPSGEVMVRDIEVPEVRKAYAHKTLITEDSLSNRFQRFSNWTRLVKGIARLIRCIKQRKGLVLREEETASLEERKAAELAIIRIVQKEFFYEEVHGLRRKDELKAHKRCGNLHKLNPFLDENGILRVGGRLKHADLHPDIKHPAIMPKASHVSNLLIEHYHAKVQHQGRGMTLSELRSNGIWILGGSRAVASCILKCVKCRKFRRPTETQKMADLPQERMETTPPFTYCGMDCFGPFYIKEGRKEHKRYGLLFTCLYSRAVHIELLDDMTTDAFINALRAFIAIRGSVRQLCSDQGTNFVGVRREFLTAVNQMNQEQLKQLGCEFVMNPPSASHMGGVWERQIRTIRTVLMSILDQSSHKLDSSSLRTYLYEIMAIVNSRPLTAHFLNDPAGPQPLTPNHLLTMKSSIILPPPGEFVKEDLYLRKRWRKVQYLANEFWSRWKKEYWMNQQSRQRWQQPSRNAKINDIVIVKDDTTPRNEWKLAKVTKVYPGKDGLVRTLQLQISDRSLTDQGKRLHKPVYLERPIHKTVTLLEAE